MLAVLRLYLLKSKRVPLLITGIAAILLLWLFTVKAVVEPNTPMHANIDLKLANLGLFIYILTSMIRRENMNKDGFLLRLPVSDLEIVSANILSLMIISVITIALSLAVSYLFIGFFKFVGYNVIVSTKKLTIDSFTNFLYMIMYIGVVISTNTLLVQTVASKSGSKVLLIGFPILLLFLIPTVLAVVMHSTQVKITDAMWEQFWNKPFWHAVKTTLVYLWKYRLIVGFVYILLAYRLRYLKEI